MTNATSLHRHAMAEIAMTPLFRGLSEADLCVLLADAVIGVHSDSDVLFEKGQKAEHFYIVLNGYVELYVEKNGRHSVLEIANPPAVLGEAGLFGDGLYPHSARIIGNTRLLAVPSASFLHTLDARFDLALRMLNSMSGRLHGLVGHISQLKLKTTAQRLASFLLGLAPNGNGSALVHFPYDKRLAAENMGMTAESLSRALQRLARLGVESRSDNAVSIADLHALRAFCIEEE